MIRLFLKSRSVSKVSSKIIYKRYSTFFTNTMACKINLDYLDYPDFDKTNFENILNKSEKLASFLNENLDNEDILIYLINEKLVYTNNNDEYNIIQMCKVAESFGENIKKALTTIIPFISAFNLFEICNRGDLLFSLISGEKIPVFAVYEENLKYPLKNNIKTEFSFENKSSIVINGLKSGILMNDVDKSNLLILTKNPVGGLNYIIVPANHPEIELVEENRLNKYEGLKSYSIKFNNLKLTSDAIIGPITDDTKDYLRSEYLKELLTVCALCRFNNRLLDAILPFVKSREIFQVSMNHYDDIRLQITLLSNRTFVLESIIYFLAGHQVFNKKTFSMEYLVAKILAFDLTESSIKSCSDLLGHNGLIHDNFLHKVNELFQLFKETNMLNIESSKQWIGSQCLEEMFGESSGSINQVRSPWQLVFSSLRLTAGVKYSSDYLSWFNLLYPGKYLHKTVCIDFNRSQLLWRHFVNQLFRIYLKYGKEALLNDEMIVNFVAEFSIKQFSLYPVFARANRAICLDLEYNKHILNQKSQYALDTYDELNHMGKQFTKYQTHNYPINNQAQSGKIDIFLECTDQKVPHPHFI